MKFLIGSLLWGSCGGAFVAPPSLWRPTSSNRDSLVSSASALPAAKIGILFGTSTGATQSVAEKIAKAFGSDVASDPVDVDSIGGSVAAKFAEFDALIVGTPTWNTGAETERSGTGWDEIYYGEMQDLQLEGKPVAVFGLGDSVSYGENYADASGEIHDVFESRGAKMMGYVSQEGYLHEASKAIRGDLFCGLLLDEVNQEDLTDQRIQNWVAQLQSEGILDAASASDAAAPATEPAMVESAAAASSSSSSTGSLPIGVFFGTSTGSTQTVAEQISNTFGSHVASEPIEIDSIQGSLALTFAQYSALIVGTPTWNTGADTERSGTGWDELYYGEMQDLQLAGKKVAVFGLGDSVSYAENYADASGELYDVFESLGCQMLGHVSQEGYEHEASKAIRGDLFCGLLLDMVNQEDMTEERVSNWVNQLKAEGILEGAATATEASAPPEVPPTTTTTASMELEMEENSRLLEEEAGAKGAGVANTGGFVPHYNPKTGKTMWTSSDGRSCYYSAVATTTSPVSTTRIAP